MIQELGDCSPSESFNEIKRDHEQNSGHDPTRMGHVSELGQIDTWNILKISPAFDILRAIFHPAYLATFRGSNGHQ
jgi:hypothetical protein